MTLNTLRTPRDRSLKISGKKTKGFTLVELIVVIVIIGLLSAVAYAVWGSRDSARDSAMKMFTGDALKNTLMTQTNTGSYLTASQIQGITGYDSTRWTVSVSTTCFRIYDSSADATSAGATGFAGIYSSGQVIPADDTSVPTACRG